MRVLIIAFLIAATASTAAAQRSGGRMGGGNWGSSPSSGGSYSGGGGSSPSWSSGGGWSSHDSSSSSHSSFWGSSNSSSHSWSSPSTTHDFGRTDYSHSYSSGDDYSSSHYSGPSIDPGTLFFGIGVITTIAILVIIFWNTFRRREAYGYVPAYAGPVVFSPGPAYPGGVDVTVLRVAIDGRARKFIQKELAQIAETADTSTDEGRSVMLREVSLLLRRVKDAWAYGGAHNEPMGPIQKAKQLYDRHVDEARTAFEQETISNVQGARNHASITDLSRRSDEGEGLILVTIVIAARNELFTVYQIGDGEDLRKALDAASYLTAQDIVAVDVVWMPSEENDRLSSIELEARYPRPQVIPIRGALVGKTFCTYCAGPFPAELVSCPHCGAPAPGREKAA
ncbi:MAG TPA: DUF1517 domain-containing protein [Kofleriaceae bacterium]|nr:DUF1517 domain-containing protein [Kofleriaceae bacterium]